MRNTGRVILGSLFVVLLLNLGSLPLSSSVMSTSKVVLQEIGQVQTGGYARDIIVRGNIAYVADIGTPSLSGGGGLVILNVSDPTHPTIIHEFNEGIFNSHSRYNGTNIRLQLVT